MMAQDSGHPAIQALLSHIDKDWTTSCPAPEGIVNGLSSRFVSQAAIKEYFKDISTVRELLEAACGPQSSHFAKWVKKDCPISFCILLKLGRGSYIRHFVRHEELFDKNMPFSAQPADFPQVIEDPAFFDSFRREQWSFFPVTVGKSHAVKLQEHRPLPVVESELLKAGDTSNLYRVKIHREYDGIDASDEEGEDHKSYALKTYIGRKAEAYFNTEVENFTRLCLDHIEPPRGLIRFHCGFEHQNTFNLLMDFATFGTLRDLFESAEPPSSGQDIVRFWEQFLLCVQALNRIHELDLSDDDLEGSKVFQGWHQDIRPENVLVHSAGEDAMAHELQFMLGDLGLSHFVRMHRSKHDPPAPDSGGTRTYGAPELYRHTDFDATRRILATRAIDIWSLGCVMLDLCIWIVRGKRYLEDFGERRAGENEKLGVDIDCFHDGRRPFPGLSTVVEAEMGRLLDDIRKSDHITGSVLDIIRRMLRPDPKHRLTAPQVLADMENAINFAKLRCNDAYSQKRNRSISHHGISLLEKIYPKNQADPVAIHSPITPSTAAASNFQGIETTEQQATLPFPEAPRPHLSNGLFITSIAAAQDGRPEPPHHQSSPVITTTHVSDAQNEVAPMGLRPHSSSAPGPQPTQKADLLSVKDDAQRIRQDPLTATEREGRRSLDRRVPHNLDVPYWPPDQAIKWSESTRFFGRKDSFHYDYCRKWLKNRDHVFLVDDSRTMSQYKEHVTTLLKPLISTVKEHDPDGVEIHFTVSKSMQQSKKSKVLLDEVDCHKFDGKTDISERLGEILRRHGVSLEDRRKSALKLNIYVLTDGVWEGGRDAKKPIRAIIDVLKRLGHDKKGQLGIQFIRFGNDTKGIRRLDDLDQFGKQPDVGLDIVDTEHFLGNVLKMLLGAIDETFDNDVSDDGTPLR